ncbi:hypothetical protein K443DRAFT_89880, partial [Laccaria amethystina LaAM-08-1]
RTGRRSHVEATGVFRPSTSPKPCPSLLHLQDLKSPLMESADEREVNNLKNVEGKAGHD